MKFFLIYFGCTIVLASAPLWVGSLWRAYQAHKNRHVTQVNDAILDVITAHFQSHPDAWTRDRHCLDCRAINVSIWIANSFDALGLDTTGSRASPRTGLNVTTGAKRRLWKALQDYDERVAGDQAKTLLDRISRDTRARP